MLNDKHGYIRTYESNSNNLSYDRILTPKTNYNFNNKFNPKPYNARTINSRDNSIERNNKLRKSNYKTLKNAVSLSKEKKNNKSIRSKQSSLDNSVNKTNNQSSVNNYLTRRHQETQQKLMKIKNENVLQELKEIKDRPIISDNSRKIIETKGHSKTNVFDRLTSKSHNRKKEMEMKKLEEMNNKNTLKPKINEYSNQIQRSIDDLLYWKENLMQKREYQINEINSHLVTNPSINKTSEEILMEKNPNYLGTKVEDRLIQQGMISKYKIEGRKEKYYENPKNSSNSKQKNNQASNRRNEFNLENVFTGASDMYDYSNMSPTSIKNLKKIANNPGFQKEVNTSIINNSVNYYSDREKINNESIPSPKNITIPNKNNPYNLHPNIKARVINQANTSQNGPNKTNNVANQFNIDNNNNPNLKENKSSSVNNTKNDYERYSNKLIPAERFLNLNTVDQIANEDLNNYQDPRNLGYQQDPNNNRDLGPKNNKQHSNPIESYNQTRNNSNNLHNEEVNKMRVERNNGFNGNLNNGQRDKIVMEQNRKVIYNNKTGPKTNHNTSQQNEMNPVNTFGTNNSQNPRVTPNFNINTSISSITNNFNFKNCSTSLVPNTTKNQSLGSASQFNLNQNESSSFGPNNNHKTNNNLIQNNHHSGKTNYSSRHNSASRNNQNNISYERSNNIPNQKGFNSVKNSANKSIEKKDLYSKHNNSSNFVTNNNSKNAKNNTRSNAYSNNLLAQSNKNNISKNKANENTDVHNTIKANAESDLTPSERIVDIRKHLDSYYKNKQVENKNNYFKEFMTTHDDSSIKNILNDYNNSANNQIMPNQRTQIQMPNTNAIDNFNNNNKNNTPIDNDYNANYISNDDINNNELKRFNYKDFKEKVLQDYQNAKNSNKYSFVNIANNFSNQAKDSLNFRGETEQISSIPLNYNSNKTQSNNKAVIQSESNQIQRDEINKNSNYNFRKDLIYSQNLNSQNTILNLKNNYNALNREFKKINSDLMSMNPNPDTNITQTNNENPVSSNANKSYISRGMLKNGRTNNLNNNEIPIGQAENIHNLSSNNNNNYNNNIYNFKREKNETSQVLDTENSIMPAYGQNYKADILSKNETKGFNGSQQDSERKSNVSKPLTNENNATENFNSRERDVNSILNFMNNLQIVNSSNNENKANRNEDGNLNRNPNSHQVNYEGEYNEINNRIDYINERLKLNEMNRNFVMTKIDSKK